MTKFEPGWHDPAEMARLKKDFNLTDLQIAEHCKYALYVNDIYQVAVRPIEGGLIHLSIKRRDRKPIHDWRDLQKIKNELVGPENEGVELYPAESRLTDTVNQYHIWVIADPSFRFPFGFGERAVSEATKGKAVQRPFSEECEA